MDHLYEPNLVTGFLKLEWIDRVREINVTIKEGTESCALLAVKMGDRKTRNMDGLEKSEKAGK